MVTQLSYAQSEPTQAPQPLRSVHTDSSNRPPHILSSHNLSNRHFTFRENITSYIRIRQYKRGRFSITIRIKTRRHRQDNHPIIKKRLPTREDRPSLQRVPLHPLHQKNVISHSHRCQRHTVTIIGRISRLLLLQVISTKNNHSLPRTTHSVNIKVQPSHINIDIPIRPRSRIKMLSRRHSRFVNISRELTQLRRQLDNILRNRTILITRSSNRLILLRANLRTHLRPIRLILKSHAIDSSRTITHIRTRRPSILASINYPRNNIIIRILLHPTVARQAKPTANIFRIHNRRVLPLRRLTIEIKYRAFRPTSRTRLLTAMIRNTLRQTKIRQRTNRRIRHPKLR